MRGAAGTDAYVDPKSGVLLNRLDINDAVELAHVEAALTASRLIDLERRRLAGRYDLAHLQAFHRYIFGDVYACPGELRTVTIEGEVFCLPEHLRSYGADVFAGWPPPIGSAVCPANCSSRDSPSCWVTSMRCTHSGRETDAGNGRLFPSWPMTPGTTSTGSAWIPRRTPPPASPLTAANSRRCKRCSTVSSNHPTRLASQSDR